MIFAWVDKGLLYMTRYTPGDPTETAAHAVFVGDHMVWVHNGSEGEVEPLLDLEKSQINMGRQWPPGDPPVTL